MMRPYTDYIQLHDVSICFLRLFNVKHNLQVPRFWIRELRSDNLVDNPSRPYVVPVDRRHQRH